MKQVLITIIVLVLLSRAKSNYDYYGEDSGDYDSGNYQDALYDSFDGPLNLDGALRQRLALNNAIADPTTSFICSPISALFPLGKLVMGATDRCQAQLLDAIGENTIKDVKTGFKSLLRHVRSVSSVKLSICSRIYVSKELTLNPKFEKNVKDVFRSTVKRIDLNAPARVASKVNSWVNSKTNGMVPQIVKPGDITKDISVLLVNAIYFSGQWEQPFRSAEKQDFYTAKSVRKVPMMKRESQYKYLKSNNLDSQIVEIPYKGGEASFVIFLPNSKDGLPILLYKLKLAPELMQIAMSQMQMKPLILSVPKFKTNSELDLKDSYKQLGVTDMFITKKGSGLDGIIQGQKDMHVSKAIQKAVIEVNEYGTRAAAVSVIKGRGMALGPNNTETIIFDANHPFMYLTIVGKEIFFAGTYVD